MMDNQDEPYTARKAGREYIAGGFFMENKIKEYMAYLEREERSDPQAMLMYGKVSQENYVELTAASAIPNKEIKSPQILRY